MSRKKRTQVVHRKKEKNPMRCGTITVEDQLKMERAARREAEIASGHNRSSGTGAHGGTKRQRRRKDRRQAKQTTRNSEF